MSAEVATSTSSRRSEDQYDPSLSYEERARIRQQQRRAKKKSGDLSLDLAKFASSSQPFRTGVSPFPRNNSSPTLAHVSPYAYVAALSTGHGRTSPPAAAVTSPTSPRPFSPTSSRPFSPLLMQHSPNPASAASGSFPFDSSSKTESSLIDPQSCSNGEPHSNTMNGTETEPHHLIGDHVTISCDSHSSVQHATSDKSTSHPPTKSITVISHRQTTPEHLKENGLPTTTPTSSDIKTTKSTQLKKSSSSSRTNVVVLSAKRTVNVVSVATQKAKVESTKPAVSSSAEPVKSSHSGQAAAKLPDLKERDPLTNHHKPVATSGEPSMTTTTISSLSSSYSSNAEAPVGAAGIQSVFSDWDNIGSRFANADSSGASSQSSSAQSTPCIARSAITEQSPIPSSSQVPGSLSATKQPSNTSASSSPSMPRLPTHGEPNVAARVNNSSNTKIIFRNDLTDSLSQDVNIVTFGHREHSDSDHEPEQREVGHTALASITNDRELASHRIMVVQATTEKKEHAEPTEQSKPSAEQKPAKKEGWRLLGSGRMNKSANKTTKADSDVKKSDGKVSKKSKKPDKQSGLLRNNSLPMTHNQHMSPVSSSSGSDITSPDPPPKERSFFRRWSLTKKSSDKSASSMQRTGWKFKKDDNNQEGSPIGLFPAKSEMFLAVIGEDTNPEPSTDFTAGMRTQSLTCLYLDGNVMASSLSQDGDIPVTVVQARSPSDTPSDDIDVVIPDLPVDIKMASELDGRDDLFQSPISMSSITLDIPGLTLLEDGQNASTDSPRPMAKFRPASVPVGKVHLHDQENIESEELKGVDEPERERNAKSTEPGRKQLVKERNQSTDSLDDVANIKEFKRFATSRKPVRKPSSSSSSTTTTQGSPVVKLKKKSSSFASHDHRTNSNLSGRPVSAGAPRIGAVANSVSKSSSKTSLASISSGSSSCVSTPRASHKSLSVSSTPTTTPLLSRKPPVTPGLKRTPTSSPKGSPKLTSKFSPKLSPSSRRAISVGKTGLQSPKITPTSSPKTSPLVRQRSGRKMDPNPSIRTGTPATTTVPVQRNRISTPSLSNHAQTESPPLTPKSRSRKQPIAPAQPSQWEKKKTVPKRSHSATPNDSPSAISKLPPLVVDGEALKSSMDLDLDAIMSGGAASSSETGTSSEQSSPSRSLQGGTPRSSGRRVARPAPPPPNKSPLSSRKKIGRSTEKQMKKSASATSTKSTSSTSSPSHSTTERRKPVPARVAPPPPSRSPTPSQTDNSTVSSPKHTAVLEKVAEKLLVDATTTAELEKDSTSGAVILTSPTTSAPQSPETPQSPRVSFSTDNTIVPPTSEKVVSPLRRKPSRPAPSPPASRKGVRSAKPPSGASQTKTSAQLSPQRSPMLSSPSAQRKAVRVSPLAKRAVLAKKKQQDIPIHLPTSKQPIAVRRKAKKAKDSGRESGDPDSPIPSTMDLLSPVNSLLSTSLSSTDTELAALSGSAVLITLEDKPLSPPPIASMPIRPFSPTTPLDTEAPCDTSVSAVTPEVPVWSDTTAQGPNNEGQEDEHLTYIYRQTLLRRSSRPEPSVSERRKTSFVRTASGKTMSSRSDSKLPQMSRASSKGRPSLASPAHSTRTDMRRTSSIDRVSMRRPSSGIARQNVDKSSTLGRPRSASIARQSIRKTTSGTLIRARPEGAAEQQATRASGKVKRTSAPSSPQHKASVGTPPTTPVTSKPPSGRPPAPPKLTATSSPKTSHSTSQSGLVNSIKMGSEERRSLRHSTGTTPISKQRAKSATTRNTLDRAAPGRQSLAGPLLSKNTPASENRLRASQRFSRTRSGSVRKASLAVNQHGTLTKRATPPPSIPGSKHTSPSHHRSRSSSIDRDEMLSAFDHVSALAEKSMVSPSSVSRMAVRPKTRQKPSARHIQLLTTRSDVSSEMKSPSSGDAVDPNAYSTYMGKKVLHTSALAGLAAKLDFTTVKLRKTGIVEQMMADADDPAGGDKVMHRRSAVSDSNSSYGVEVTKHDMMLIQIKGRKQVQTRLVESVPSSLNNGDVFILVRGRQLFLWLGRSANVIEKARGNDIAARIYQKKELGCHANGFCTVEDRQRQEVSLREKEFLDLLGAKNDVKVAVAGSVPADEVYEKAVNMATKVYQFNTERGVYESIHENSSHMIKIGLLDSKKVLLFDFYCEVYVWVGKHSPSASRKPAVIKAREMYDAGCSPPVFANNNSPTHKISVSSSPNRASGRFRPRSGSRGSGRYGTLNSSTRRKSSKTAPVIKGATQPRPHWTLFRKITEGGEPILFREKFVDWPEPGRIIKMKGHESSGEVIKAPPMPELQPADVESMLKPEPPFGGLRLEGENIHRGRGNFKVSRSTFACNRVRLHSMSIWHIKEYDKVLLTDKQVGLFYSGEGYVVRWGYTITVVRELEGLTPGTGGFARDRELNRKLLRGNSNKPATSVPSRVNNEDSDDDDKDSEEGDESGDEVRRILESGGRDRCAYFFWQGEHASVNEKGAVALMTVELDEEKGPQVRVPQRREPPAFLQLFNGGMVVLCGKSEQSTVHQHRRGYRLYLVKGVVKPEAALIEVEVHDNTPLFYYLRSRGCYVLHHMALNTIFVWVGANSSDEHGRIAMCAARKLRKRLGTTVKVEQIHQYREPVQLHNILGDWSKCTTTTNTIDPSLLSQGIRLFELSSSGGWFTASEVLHTARGDTTDPFPFLQDELYSADQPAIFLLDARSEIYLWLGWWPEQKNILLKENNVITGSAHSRWLRDKKLALQTALNYANGCKRPHPPRVYMVCAGTEHGEFINLFPFWNESQDVQEIVFKDGVRRSPTRVDAEAELAKYSRTQFSLAELKTHPHPEGVDPSRLETYLSDTDFLNVFTISREKFEHLPHWKKVELKKKVGLF